MQEGADALAQAPAPAALVQLSPDGLASRAVDQAAGGASLSPAPADEGGCAETAGVTDSLLPPQAMPTDAVPAEQPGSPAIRATYEAAAPVKPALRGSPGRKGLPGASLIPAISRQQQLGTSSPSVLWAGSGGGSSGARGGSPKRGTSVLTSHLTKELVSLQEELLVKSDLADVLACKVWCPSCCHMACLHAGGHVGPA